MKYFLEFLSGLLVGVVFAILVLVMDIEMTGLQLGILAGSTAFTTYLLMEATSAILKKRESKKTEK